MDENPVTAAPAAPRLRWFHLRPRVLVLAIALGGVFYYFGVGRYRFPEGEGPAGPPVPSEAFRVPWREGRVLLVGLGDSVTAGFGATEGRSYFELLQRNDDAACPDMAGRDLRTVFPNLVSLDNSCSCTTSGEHVRGLNVFLPAQPPEVFGVVVITSGGNDLLHDYGRNPSRDGAMYGATWEQARPWISALRTRIEQLVDATAARFPGGCEIFLANIYDPTDGVGDIENAHLALPAWPDGERILTKVNADLRAIADARPNVHLVDMHGTMLGHGIHCRDKDHPHYDAKDPHFWFFRNLEDPNDRGYDAIRRAFLLEMIRVLGKSR